MITESKFTGGIYSISTAPVSFGLRLGPSSTSTMRSSIRKVTGKTYFTFTVSPFSFPGLQSGIILIMRRASWSNRGWTLYATLGCTTFPFRSITLSIQTFPSIFCIRQLEDTECESVCILQLHPYRPDIQAVLLIWHEFLYRKSSNWNITIWLNPPLQEKYPLGWQNIFSSLFSVVAGRNRLKEGKRLSKIQYSFS